MDAIKETSFVQNKINFHLIPSKKFKTINIVVKCKASLDRQTITKRSLLPYLLEQGTVTYPSEKLLMQRLDELYGSVLSIGGQKKGNNHIITFRLEVANEKFLPNAPAIMEDVLKLLEEIIFSPNEEQGVFPKKVVEREKITLRNKISSLYDDKLAYANMRLIDHMCEDEIYRIHPNGYEDDIPEISKESAYQYYKKMLEEDEMDLYIVGDIATDTISELVKKTFTKRTNKVNTKSHIEHDINVNDPKEIVEEQAIQQAKLHIGYRTNITYEDKDYFTLHVFNGLFGGFPSSKLFINVREKNSLAYYAASRIESHKGLLIVYSGIESENYQKARDIITLQMKELQAGNFNDEEVENTKELVISEIKETLDHSQGIVELLYQQIVANKEMPPTTFIEGIKQVTKEDILKVSKKITLDTIYLLTNSGEAKKDGTKNI